MSEKNDLRQRLIEEASTLPIRKQIKVEAFLGGYEGDLDLSRDCDEGGDVVYMVRCYSASEYGTLQIYFPAKSNTKDIVQGLKKVIKKVKRNKKFILSSWGCDETVERDGSNAVVEPPIGEKWGDRNDNPIKTDCEIIEARQREINDLKAFLENEMDHFSVIETELKRVIESGDIAGLREAKEKLVKFLNRPVDDDIPF